MTSVRTRMLGLIKTIVQKINKEKIYVDNLLSKDDLFFEA